MANSDNHKTKVQLIEELNSFRSQSEEKLREAEARYKTIRDHKILCIYEYDLSGNFISANDATLNLLGYSKEDIPSLNLSALLDENQLPSAIKTIEEVINSGKKKIISEYRLRKKDGSYIWVITEIGLVCRDGKPFSILGVAMDITERKKVENDLRKSQETYRLLVENTSDFMWIQDFEFRTLYQSPALTKILGFTPEEQSKRTALDKYPPDQIEKLSKIINEQIEIEKTGADPNRSITVELVEYHKDGHLVPCETTATFVRDENGRPTAYQGITRDITQRKQMEELNNVLRDLAVNLASISVLQEALEKCLDAAINVSKMDSGAIFLFEKETGALYSACARGVSEDFVKKIPNYPPYSDRAQIIKKGSAIYTNYPSFISDKNNPPLEEGLKAFAVIPIKHHGKVIGSFNIASHKFDEIPKYSRMALETICAEVGNIIARLQAEQSLKEKQEELQTLFDTIEDFLIVFDAELKIIRVNRLAIDRLGYSENEMISQNLLMLHPEDSRKKAKAILNDIFSGKRNSYSIPLITKNGDIIQVDTKIAFGRWGAQDLFFGVSRDVTEQKRLEEQLRHVAKMEAIGQLAGGVAHDFNNLLTGILGYANLIMLYPNVDQTVFEWVKTMEKAAIKASELTKQLLGFARRGKHQLVPVDMRKTINEVVTLLKRTFEKNITIALRLNADNSNVSGDPSQMHQVILNLVINARDAMPEGGELSLQTDNVELDEEYCLLHPGTERGQYLRLSVTDTGSGIPDSIKERIFEPFFTTKPEGKGTGMGLPMVYGIVKNHGGNVQVYSEYGHGSTFKVYLPSMIDDEIANTDQLFIGDYSGSANILLIDDEDVARNAAKDMLQTLGYKVVPLAGGAEAIEYYSEHKDEIDLVIIDMIMPDIDGRKVFTELKKITPNVKAILSTGYGMNGKAQDLINQGMLDFLQKPYHIEELSKIINQALKK